MFMNNYTFVVRNNKGKKTKWLQILTIYMKYSPDASEKKCTLHLVILGQNTSNLACSHGARWILNPKTCLLTDSVTVWMTT